MTTTYRGRVAKILACCERTQQELDKRGRSSQAVATEITRLKAVLQGRDKKKGMTGAGSRKKRQDVAPVVGKKRNKKEE